MQEGIKKKINIKVFRAGIISGDTGAGEYYSNQGMLIQFLRVLKSGVIDSLPVTKDSKIYIIPVNLAANMILDLMRQDEPGGTYHLVPDKTWTATELIKYFCQKMEVPLPKIFSLDKFSFNKLTPVQRRMFLSFAPYLNLRFTITNRFTKKSLGGVFKNGFSFNSAYFDKLLKRNIKC